MEAEAEVVEEEEIEAAEVTEEVEEEVRVKVREVRIRLIGGLTSPNTLTTLLLEFAGNIMFMGRVLTGVRSRQRVLGKTTSSLKINETGASLNLLTYKRLCIQIKNNQK